jgi:hypothetical protein
LAAPKGNQYALGCETSGRPRKYNSVEEMDKKIQEYFDECDNNTKEILDKKDGGLITISFPLPYTVEGLALALGFCDRNSLLDYQKEEGYEEYFRTIKNAKLKTQQNKVVNGLTGVYNSAVTIFDLKNNHGYRERNETDITSGGEKLELPQIYLPENGH